MIGLILLHLQIPKDVFKISRQHIRKQFDEHKAFVIVHGEDFSRLNRDEQVDSPPGFLLRGRP